MEGAAGEQEGKQHNLERLDAIVSGAVLCTDYGTTG